MMAQRYVYDVLRPAIFPYLQWVPSIPSISRITPDHTTRISQQALQDVHMLPWPPYSPDLSPIEHVWDIIGRRLHALPQSRSKTICGKRLKRNGEPSLRTPSVSVVAVNFLEHSVGFSVTFLPVEGGQQNFPQMGTFWLGNHHFPRAPEIFHELNFSKTPRMLMPQAKERLLRIFKDGESKRIRKLLSGIELGDLKPSQLLQKLKSLATEDLSDKFIKTLWLEKLPQAIQQILIISEEELDKLAVMADRIAELNPKAEIYEADKPENETKMLLKNRISGTENRKYENGASR
ncbi:hypothetical protein LAZ67_2004730 [Cordylochernes scorpioides]|uniref:Transposase n=1 Tax=Cordylochernes scorpioides TaxID=51811 RepID=A0ABY6K3X3_9ARAC|nr:hypothetical protein LAZ67_2004730 [Cordylochernes scorpioides]